MVLKDYITNMSGFGRCFEVAARFAARFARLHRPSSIDNSINRGNWLLSRSRLAPLASAC